MSEITEALDQLREKADPALSGRLGTLMGLLMSARASQDAAMRLLSELIAESVASGLEPAEEGVCEHPADQRSVIATMGDEMPQEFCKVCGERLSG